MYHLKPLNVKPLTKFTSHNHYWPPTFLIKSIILLVLTLVVVGIGHIRSTGCIDPESLYFKFILFVVTLILLVLYSYVYI